MVEGNQSSAEQAREWVEKNREVVLAAYQMYEETGEWPRIGIIQRALDKRDVKADVQVVADSKPTTGIQQWSLRSDFLSLQIRHLMWLDEAKQLVDICIGATKRAVEAYLSDQDVPSVSSNEQLTPFASDNRSLQKLRVFNVLTMEGPSPFSGGGFSEDSWTAQVDTRFVMFFKGVESASDFCAVQDRIRSSDVDRLPAAVLSQATSLRPLPLDGTPDEAAEEGLDETLSQRPMVFLSWGKETSRQVAEILLPMLETRLPGVEVFFSPRSIDPGDDPLDRLFDESLMRCQALVVVLTQAAAESAYVIWEVASTWARRKLVIPIFVDVSIADIPGPLVDKLQGVRLLDPRELGRGFERLAKAFDLFEVSPILATEMEDLRNAAQGAGATRPLNSTPKQNP